MTFSNGQLAKNYASQLKIPEPGKVQTKLAFEIQTMTFWKYAEGCWSVVERDIIGNDIRKFCMMVEATAQITMGKIKDIVEQLTFEIDRHDILEDSWISFIDGSWEPDSGEFAPHSPERFSTIKVNALYGNLPRSEDAPIFHKFLSEVCVDEQNQPIPEMLLLLQEMFGYCLLASADRAVSFFLTGKGRNGKGVLSGIIQAMIGSERVSHMKLSDLTTNRFSVASLVGKRLNIADETNTHRDAASDMFKSLVAVDTIMAERKFERAFSFTPKTKYIFLMNGVPTFDGFDYALRERIIAIPFFRSFSEDERDYGLKAKIIKSEMPAVIAWAIEGLRRLQKNNLRFTKYNHSEACLTQFEDASSSLSEFFNEGWEISSYPYPARDFYNEFVEWARQNGRKQMSANRVTREMIDKVGKTTRVRHPISGLSVPGLMIQKKKLPEHQKTLEI